jgi:hypothetical protein
LAPETKPSLFARISSWLRRLREILASFWGSARSLLSRLAAPFKKFDYLITPKHNTEKEGAGSHKEPPIITEIMPTPPPDEKAKKTVYVYTPWWKTGAEMLGIAAIIVYTIVSYCQWETAKDTLIASERPWVTLDVGISGPFIIDANGANVRTRMTLQNVGHSPAIGVAIWTRFYPYTLNNRDAASERQKVCSQAPIDPTTTGTIFQESKPSDIPRGDYLLQIEKAELDNMIQSKGLIAPTIMVCVVYRTTFNDELHHTVRTLRLLFPGSQPFLKVGETRNIPPESLILLPYPFAATDAN